MALKWWLRCWLKEYESVFGIFLLWRWNWLLTVVLVSGQQLTVMDESFYVIFYARFIYIAFRISVLYSYKYDAISWDHIFELYFSVYESRLESSQLVGKTADIPDKVHTCPRKTNTHWPSQTLTWQQTSGYTTSSPPTHDHPRSEIATFSS